MCTAWMTIYLIFSIVIQSCQAYGIRHTQWLLSSLAEAKALPHEGALALVPCH